MSAEATAWAWSLAPDLTTRQTLVLLAIADGADNRFRWREDLRGVASQTGIGTASCNQAIEDLKDAGILRDMANSGFIQLGIVQDKAQIQEEIQAPKTAAQNGAASTKAQIESAFAAYTIVHSRFFESRNDQRPPSPSLTSARRKRIASSLREHGYKRTVLAGVGIFFSPFHRGENRDGALWIRPEHAWRMGKEKDNIEEFAGLAEGAWRNGALPEPTKEMIRKVSGVEL